LDHKLRSYQIQTAKVLLIKAALHFSALLPLRWAHAIATPIASIVWALSSDSRRITRCNLALCFPQLTEREREKLARASALETTKFACELGRVWLRSVDEVLASIVSVSGQEVLEREPLHLKVKSSQDSRQDLTSGLRWKRLDGRP
jgi:KDO2-lipid IV(A) lauroyltransferase